ncbi:Y-family DNA polymerase [Fodinicurvata halophila]|uniref:DNA-directed DNA polymerase n=2 Tax=Fodinicurvata halophila TaxID=1419723 RepID=A0ABV8UNK2_9PROT
MRRVVSIYLPTWPTDRAWKADRSLPPDRPLALLDTTGRVLLAVDTPARHRGLRAGQALSLARSLVPELETRPGTPEEDARGLLRLAEWVYRHYAPLVAPDPPDGLLVDTTGADHLHGGEVAMLQALRDRLAGAGFAARLALADTPGAAHALARYDGEPCVRVAPGEHRAALAPLPLAALRLDPDQVDRLETLGFARIGDLMGQPRAPLTRRFGPQLLQRLDEALGDRYEPLTPLRPAGVLEVEQVFGEPIAAAETIARYLDDLARELCRKLETQGQGVRRLDLICRRVDRQGQAVMVRLARPSRAPDRLAELLCDRIETIDPGFGIETLVLRAARAETLQPAQRLNELGAAQAADPVDLVDRLANRLGAGRLYRQAPVESDVPERSVRRVDPLAAARGPSWPARWPRPVRLLRRPEPIEALALLPDYPPAAFVWQGSRYRVVAADGPERIHGEWWKRDAETWAVRDYFRVEDDSGGRYWIFRSGDGVDGASGTHRWFLQGFFG